MKRVSKTFVQAFLAALLSFTFTISVLANAPVVYQTYWPGSCAACTKYAPGIGNDEESCRNCCENTTSCSDAGQPIVNKCKTCCGRYNYFGNNAQHCGKVNFYYEQIKKQDSLLDK